MEAAGFDVFEWADQSSQCCIPVDNLAHALLVVSPPPCQMGNFYGRWLLIFFEGKRFGLDYCIDDADVEEVMGAGD